MDRRQKKTRNAIINAFTDLLKAETYSRITVQQIIDRADIGRTTFIRLAPEDYLLNHMICDFSETIRWWSRNPGYSPDEICNFFLENNPVPE